MTDNPSDEPKIIVDDDWKSQVEREKEELQQKTDSPQPDDAAGAAAPQMELPEASFLVLLSTLGSQAMACMGLLPDPSTGEANVNLPLAKHFVDMIAMLQEKTKGNLSDEESAHVRDALHQLRMIYVSSSSSPAPTTASDSGDSKPASKIELP